MTILAIDTSLEDVQVGVLRSDGLELIRCFKHKRDALQRLTPLIRQILTEAELSARDIGYVACVVGPGSFTGLRVGVAAAKALSDAVSAQTVGLSTLELLAQSVSCNSEIIVPLIEAVPGELYSAVYRRGSSSIETLVPATVKSAQDVHSLIASFASESSVAVTGPAAGSVTLDIVLECVPLASVDMRAALKSARLAADTGRTLDAMSLQPVYLRVSQAEIRAHIPESR
ncbi:MAG: tRNA (adenosine(37)-N6)-threonylcarbamoyltransferase complex dimerization subunit type 1 TsaB [Armatimonadetes bacterium]|nr:tRNA (adenosine(37)-N6)-threonylcarbamoyltransferase complex dimerization subunit type 1 TsaB [Armatimonadota bacterium]